MNRLVFGCGYLGSRVAQAWSRAGDRVFAVTRSKSRAKVLESHGFSPIVADIMQPETLTGLPQADTVLVAIGMDRTRYNDIRAVYVGGLQAIIDALPEGTGQLVYISSTGVYGQSQGEWVDEHSPTEPTRDGGQACLEAEQLLLHSRFANSSTILRLAGIYGKGRVPSLEIVKSKSWDKLEPHGFLNLVHVADIVTAVLQTAAQKLVGEIILISDGSPVVRRDYYQALANELGMGEIPWPRMPSQSTSRRSSGNKRISNQKMLNLLDFELEFPNIQEGLKNALSLRD
jgi:nucleoside-diphosphate-sugar epimerase